MKRRLLLILSFAITFFISRPSAAVAGDALSRVSKKIAHDIGGKHPRVALLSFPYNDDRESPGSTIVAERLTTLLVDQKKVRVIERHLLTKILEEQHLSETGAIDGSAAKQIGKVLGVDFLVTGTLQDLPEMETQVNARAINVLSGEVASAASVTIDKTWSDHAPVKRLAPQAERVDDAPPPQDEAIEVGYPSDRAGAGPGPKPVMIRGGVRGGFRR